MLELDPREWNTQMSQSKKQAARPASKKSIASYEVLMGAIEGFVRTNANFESSIPVDAALEEIGSCTSLQDAFAVPLQRQLFGMDAALRLVLFLTLAPERGAEEGGAPAAFAATEALSLVAQVYDIGVQDTVWEHFDVDDDDDQVDDE